MWISLLAWLAVTPLFGAIVLDGVASRASTSPEITMTYPMAVGAGAHRVLIVGVGYYNRGAAVASVTYGGTKLELLRRDNDGTHAAATEYWYLVAPASGTADIAVKLNSPACFASGALSFSGVHQLIPVDAHASGFAPAGTPGNPGSITPVSNDAWIADFLVAGALPSPGSGQTLAGNGAFLGTSGYYGFSYRGPLAAATPAGDAWSYASNGAASMKTIVSLTPDTATPPPTLTSVSPAAAGQGSSVNVTLTGAAFLAGAAVSASGADVTVSDAVIVDAQHITAKFTIAEKASLGTTSVRVTTAAGTSGTQPFAVTRPPPTIASISPESGSPGTSVMLILTGTNFQAPVTLSTGSPYLSASKVSVIAPDQITAVLKIASPAAGGSSAITITTPAGVTNVAQFTIKPPVVPPSNSVTIKKGKEKRSTNGAHLSIAFQTTGYTGGAVVVPVTFFSKNVKVSAIQFDLLYPPGLSLSAVPGNAVRTARKALYDADVTPTQKRFLVVGLNRGAIPDGVLLELTITSAANVAPGDYALTFATVVASSSNGTATAIYSQDGRITLQAGDSAPQPSGPR
jgi:hypothetical protein